MLDQPLKGIRVLSMAQAAALPFAMLNGQHNQEVLSEWL